MRQLGIMVLALLLAGCKDKIDLQKTQEEPPEDAAVIQTGDLKANGQFVGGFYGIEGGVGGWRWTAKQFQVRLGVPSGGPAKGGLLTFAFTYPDASFQKLGPANLRAIVKDTVVGTYTATKAGEQNWDIEIPAEQLRGREVFVTFVLDKVVPPSEQDKRELGVVANRFSLKSK